MSANRYLLYPNNIGETFETQIEERLGVEALAAVIMNFDSDCIEEYESLVAALDRGDVRFKPKKYELDKKNNESPHAKPSIEEAPKLELDLSHLISGMNS